VEESLVFPQRRNAWEVQGAVDLGLWVWGDRWRL
jgi:hypothetical protein